eukprot:3345669-Prymnesium_polylepis.1
MPVYDPEEKAFLLPELTGSNAGTKLSNYIKGVQSDMRVGAQKKYSDREGATAPSLPPEPTAAGVRPGAAETLACAVPAEFAVHNTGHDFTSLSALWNYLQGRIALTIQGVTVLAGWLAFPYGQMGKGPKHPTLVALIGVSTERLELFIDFIFSFAPKSGGKHNPILLVGGELRPLIHATVATMIMYYDE